MYSVKEICNAGRHQWNNFVFENNGATVFHLFEWKNVFEKSYKLQTYYLGLYLNEKLVAVLPAALINKPFAKPIAISLPFCNYAGLLFDTALERNVVVRWFIEFLQEKKVYLFEERRILNDNYDSLTEECTLKLELPSGSEKLWHNLTDKVRNQIRKAEKSGLTVRWGIDQIKELYYIYSRNMSSLGTPVHSFRFLESICLNLKNNIDILTVRKDGKAIAAMLLLKFKRQLSNPIASSLKSHLSMNPNMLLYWEALRYGCENGFEEFDFGRSQINSGTYKFKKQWGAVPQNLIYECYSTSPAKMKSSISSYRGIKAKIFSSIWKNIPYQLTLLIGPRLRKYLP